MLQSLKAAKTVQNLILATALLEEDTEDATASTAAVLAADLAVSAAAADLAAAEHQEAGKTIFTQS